MASPWNSVDLAKTIHTLSAIESCFHDARILYERGVQQSAELVLLGLTFIQPLSPMAKDLAGNLIAMFLSGHPSSSFLLRKLWSMSPSLTVSGMAYFYSKDSTSLPMILDVAQDLKALTRMLSESRSFYFTIDLAVLGIIFYSYLISYFI